jgi:hypothetical protein
MPYDRSAKGWAFGDVLPVFKSQEHWEGGANDWRGAGGPIHIRRPKDPDAGTDFLIAGDARAAAVYLFFEKLPDLGFRGRIPVRRIEKLGRGRKEVQ